MRPIALAFLLVTVSCGVNQPTYLDRVRPLAAESAHPFLLQLLPLIQKPEGRDIDELVRTWKDFLGESALPLRRDTAVTFVYYDFSRSLKEVYLEASFAPGLREPLERVGSSPLFYRVFDVPKIDRLRYRFSDGTQPLLDPFHRDVASGKELWQLGPEAPDAEIQVQRILGASEGGLLGQNLGVALPPGYRRNLASTYPLLIIVGLDDEEWSRPFSQLMEQQAIRPVVAVSLGSQRGSAWSAQELKRTLEEAVLPWAKFHYRISPQPGDLILVGWADSAPAVVSTAASRPELWSHTWIPLPTMAKGDEAWNSQTQAWLRAQFALEKP